MNMRLFWILTVTALGAAATPSGALRAAEEATNATVGLPDLAVSAQSYGDPRKYFIFHKEGVTVDQAKADLRFCWRFLPHGAMRRAPSFIPWRQAVPVRPVSYDSGQFGLVGSVVGAIIAGPIERSLRQSRLFRCMGPRGYARYRTSQAVWNQLNGPDAAASIEMQARIAAGPVPPTPRIVP